MKLNPLIMTLVVAFLVFGPIHAQAQSGTTSNGNDLNANALVSPGNLNEATPSGPVFQDEEVLPITYTEDGKKISPPLMWQDVPKDAQCLVLLIEDPDAPTPSPITHAIVLDMSPAEGFLKEGALPAPGGSTDIFKMGDNSFGKSQYLPPDPPPGHGPHRYMFELYALDIMTGLNKGASRKELVEAMEGHVLAKGLIIATYERK